MADIMRVKRSTMTSLGDITRSLTGTTGNLTTDQMQSELTTAKTNIDNAFSALAAKGATVPEGATIADLVAAVETVPEGGGGGGATPDTCTVIFNTTEANVPHGGYTICADGVISTQDVIDADCEGIVDGFAVVGMKYTLSNVVCGSAITIVDDCYAWTGCNISGGASLINSVTNCCPLFIFQAPTTAGATAIITFTS